MKKNIFIMIFMSAILSVFIPIKARALVPDIEITLPNYNNYLELEQLTKPYWYINPNVLCYYYTDSVGTQDYVYCTFGNFSQIMQEHIRFANDYNPYGLYFYQPQSNRWIQEERWYANSGLVRWNGYYWDIVCFTGTNECTDTMPYTDTTKTFITYYKTYKTDDPLYNFYNAQPFNAYLDPVTTYTSEYYFNPTGYDIRITFTPTTYDDTQFVTIDYEDPLDQIEEPILFYSFNGTDWTVLSDITKSGDYQSVYVYTNGPLYVKVNSNGESVYYATYNVTGMTTIDGYSVYNIPYGNQQVYISDFGNDTTGEIYFSSIMYGSTYTLNYLDANGVVLGSDYITLDTYKIINVPTEDTTVTFLSLPYDITKYNGTKMISFNAVNEGTYTIWVKNNLYVYIVNLNEPYNYDCNTDTNIDNSQVSTNCQLKVTYKDNGQTTSTNDSSITNDSTRDLSYFDSIKNVVNANLPILTGVTKDFTTFYNSMGKPLRMAFAMCFAIFFVYFISKVMKY